MVQNLNLTSPVKRNVYQNVFSNNDKPSISQTESYEKIFSAGVMKHLKTLWLEKKYLHFHQFIFYICGDELINDDQFLFWLCDKLKMNHRCTRLIQSIRKARENNFSNIHG